MCLGDRGAALLADGLRRGLGQRVKALYLGSNGIGDDGARALTEALRLRPACKLRFLYMNGNDLVGRATASVLHAICAERHVTLVGLGATPMARPHLSTALHRLQPVEPHAPACEGHGTIPTHVARSSPSKTLVAPSPFLSDLLPCCRGRQRMAQRGKDASIAGSSADFLPVARLHEPRVARSPVRKSTACSRPRPGTHSSPRYRATRPACGPSVPRLDVMASCRVGQRNTQARSADGADGPSCVRAASARYADARRAAASCHPSAAGEAAAGAATVGEKAASAARELRQQHRELLELTRQRQQQLKQRAFADRIPWQQHR